MTAHLSPLYTNGASVYDKLFERTAWLLHQWAADQLRCAAGMRILDVGVGTGLALRHYPRDVSIVGIDLSAEMLARARERVERQGLTNASLCQMDAAELAFADDSFDAVIATFVATVVDDHAKLTREVARVVRPGGQVIFFNHFCTEAPVLRDVVRVASPFCARLGWHTVLTVTDFVAAAPLRLVRVGGPLRLGVWRLVEMVKD